MLKKIKAKCLDCGQRFTDEIGNPRKATIYRCQRCGKKLVCPFINEGFEPPKNCEKCDGPLGPNLPVCPRCYSLNVKFKYVIFRSVYDFISSVIKPEKKT
jgi:hypothetical protein